MWVPPLPRRHDGLCRVLFMEVIIMVRQVKVSNFAEVQGIVSAAAKCYNEVGVHDMKGSIADAKSILGMMSLDYSHPVKIVCEDERDLNSVVLALLLNKEFKGRSFFRTLYFLPAVLSTIFCEVLRKKGWIKEGDLKL